MSGRKNILFKSKESKSCQNVADFLRRLADRVETGEISLTQGSQEISLSLPDSVQLELEVVEKDKKRGLKRELEIELEWYENAESGPVELR